MSNRFSYQNQKELSC